MRLFFACFLAVSSISCGGSSGNKETPISATNNSPVINLASTMAVDEKQRVKLTATATDSDGTIQKISWQQSKGPQIELQAADTLTPEFIAPEVLNTQTPQTIGLTLTVTDNQQASTRQTIDIKVSPANEAPTLNADESYTGFIGETVTINCSATDPDQDELSLTLKQVSGPDIKLPAAQLNCPIKLELPAAAGRSELELTLTDSLNLKTVKRLVLTTEKYIGKQPDFNPLPFHTIIKNNVERLTQHPSRSELLYAISTTTAGAPDRVDMQLNLLNAANLQQVIIADHYTFARVNEHLARTLQASKNFLLLNRFGATGGGTDQFSIFDYMPISEASPLSKPQFLTQDKLDGNFGTHTTMLPFSESNYLYTKSGKRQFEGTECVYLGTLGQEQASYKSCDTDIATIPYQALNKEFVFAIDEKRLKIFDHKLKLLNTYLPEGVSGFGSILFLEKEHLFITDGAKLFILNISDIQSPQLLSSLALPAIKKVEAIHNNKLYVSSAQNNYIRVINITEPTTPTLEQEFLASERHAGFAFVNEQILFSDSNNLLQANTDNNKSFQQQKLVADEKLYAIISEQGLVYTLSATSEQKTNLAVFGIDKFPSDSLANTELDMNKDDFQQLYLHQGMLYIFTQSGDTWVVDVNQSQPELIATYNLSPYNGTLLDIVMQDNRAFLLKRAPEQQNKVFAIELDISTPKAPSIISVGRGALPVTLINNLDKDGCYLSKKLLHILNGKLYIYCSSSLVIGINIEQPNIFNPPIYKTYDLSIRSMSENPFTFENIVSHQSYLFANSNSEIKIWKEVTTTTDEFPYKLVHSLPMRERIKSMSLINDNLYIVTDSGLSIFKTDISGMPHINEHMHLDTELTSILGTADTTILASMTQGYNKITQSPPYSISLEEQYHQVTSGQSLSYKVKWQFEQAPSVSCQVTAGLCEVTNNNSMQHIVTWELKGVTGGQQIQINIGNNHQFRALHDQVQVQ